VRSRTSSPIIPINAPVAAQKDGRFADEIVPVARQGEGQVHSRKSTSILALTYRSRSLAALKPVRLAVDPEVDGDGRQCERPERRRRRVAS